MKDDPKSNIQFVKLVEKYPVLYDVRFDGYSRKEAQDEAWNSVANAMQDTVPSCKEKWRNIRTCLTRHLRQAKSIQKSSGKLRRPYYLAPYMNFLIPFTKSRVMTQEYYMSSEENPDPLRYDSYHTGVSDDDTDCSKPRIVDIQGNVKYEPFSREGRMDCPKVEEAITEEEEEDEDVIEVVEEDAIEAVEEEENMEEEMDGRKPVNEEEEVTKKKSLDPPAEATKKRRMDEDSKIDIRDELRTASSGGLSTIRINHFDGKNARISVERGSSPPNADLDFFKSILPEVNEMTRAQKSKFRISVLTSLHELLYESREES